MPKTLTTAQYDNLCKIVSSQIADEGIRKFAARTKIPVSTVHQWVHRTQLQCWNAGDIKAALLHTGGRLILWTGPTRTKSNPTRRVGKRSPRTKAKPQAQVPNI